MIGREADPDLVQRTVAGEGKSPIVPGAHRRARDLSEVGPTAAAVHVEPGAARLAILGLRTHGIAS